MAIHNFFSDSSTIYILTLPGSTAEPASQIPPSTGQLLSELSAFTAHAGMVSFPLSSARGHGRRTRGRHFVNSQPTVTEVYLADFTGHSVATELELFNWTRPARRFTALVVLVILAAVVE